MGAVAGAALGVTVEPLMQRVWDELAGDSRAAAGAVLQVASHRASLTPEQMTDAIVADERRRLLGGLALASGSRTRNEHKIRALGLALAEGVLADDRLDEEELIIRALDDLEAPHIAVLELLVDFTPGGETPHPYTGSDTSDLGAPGRRWPMHQFRSALPSLRTAIPAVLGAIERHGLALQVLDIHGAFENYAEASKRDRRFGADERPSASFRRSALPDSFRAPTAHWVPTELGERVLDYLRKAPASEAD